MAEIFGTAAGVLQVAEVGFSLATTLYKYAASVKGAEKEIKKIARDVRLTSKVLERTHAQLKADQQAQLCTDDALHDLEEVLEGCKEAFQEVDSALNKTLKPGADGKVGISTFEKFKWPFRNDKLEVLRANLEKLKTTLLLMLSVLAYGSKISQNRTEHTSVKVELTLEKLQIQNLVQAKDEATQRYEELSAAFQKLETRISNSANFIPGPGPGSYTTSLFTMPQPQDPSLYADSMPAPSTSVSSRLSLCTTAVSKLTISIEAATKLWESSKVLEHNGIWSSLNETTQAVHALQLESSGNHALQDYQMQLMLLENQNKKRLMMARQEQDAMGQAQNVQMPQQQMNMAKQMQEQQSSQSPNAQSPQSPQYLALQAQRQAMQMAQQRCFTGRQQQQQQAMEMAQQQQQQQQQESNVQQQHQIDKITQMTPNRSSSKLDPSPSQETLRPAHPSSNFLLPDDEGDVNSDSSRTFGASNSKSSLGTSVNPKLSNSCVRCAASKLRCSQDKPTCASCAKRGLSCEYNVAKRSGRMSPRQPVRGTSIKPRSAEGSDLPAALVQQYPALANLDWNHEPRPVPVPVTPAHPTSFGELQDSGDLDLDLDLGTAVYEEHNAAGTFDFSGVDLEYIPHTQKPPANMMATPTSSLQPCSWEQSPSVASKRLGRARAKSDMPLTEVNKPFGAIGNDQFDSMDFANLDSGDVLDNFDFDSFLNKDDADEGLGFDPNFAFGDGGIEIDMDKNAQLSLQNRPLGEAAEESLGLTRPDPSLRGIRGRALSDMASAPSGGIGVIKRRRGSSSDNALRNREQSIPEIDEDEEVDKVEYVEVKEYEDEEDDDIIAVDNLLKRWTKVAG